jgi:hypothetical protein
MNCCIIVGLSIKHANQPFFSLNRKGFKALVQRADQNRRHEIREYRLFKNNEIREYPLFKKDKWVHLFYVDYHVCIVLLP